MKNTLSTLVIIALLSITNLFVANAATNPNSTDPTNNEEIVNVKRGTKITLQLMSDVSSRDLEKGRVVEMMVMMDVIVDGQKVVAAGTYAEGIVKDVRRAGVFGKGGYLEVEGINIRTVDGQRVGIKSMKVSKRGKSRKGLAIAAGVLIPVVGIIVNPYLIPFAVIGLVVKGRNAEISSGTLMTAKILEDIEVKF